ncbi:MAG: PEP/pyruvate-binding domain-containing protein [Calditrichaceae bacterium]|nr:PEP/pyruvate-binding domain-containing protein [Calditrichaceae bacterium]
MLNYLVWRGVKDSQDLLKQFSPSGNYQSEEVTGEKNIPLEKRNLIFTRELSSQVFEIAARNLNSDDLLALIQKWMQEDKTAFLVRAVSTKNTSLNEIADAIRRYYQLTPEGMELVPSARLGVRANLIRRIFSDQLEFINIAKNYFKVSDFRNLLPTVVYPENSHGKLGGKTAGMLLAHSILRHFAEENELLRDIKMPKSWYLTSDVMINFMNYNNMEEILEQKYKNIDEIKKEYPHVILLFKNSYFPADILKGLSMALDDFGEVPLVVRSSSLLEDRLGSAFAGKYKSLFIANQGTKQQRLSALVDAITEVFASTLGPDPIGYRAEKGLLDFHEEMGVIIQEVVGKQVGDYFFPAYAGVAFSNNEFRWSPRIQQEDGLVRMVPGLGTRAVDRLSDDYPVLLAPGKPGLRANVRIEDIVRYSPQKLDVLNLKTNTFETIELTGVLKEYGDAYPALKQLVSVYEHGDLKPLNFHMDFTQIEPVVTFNGLINNTNFVKKIKQVMSVLQGVLATPVDIEFASDGQDFYLLQCRPQSYSKYMAPCPIPKDIPAKKTIFSANKYISNGMIPEIKYVVYVDPEEYSKISSHENLIAVGQVIGELNKVLPEKKFILMGPGRWGSRGDIKLGVSVTYTDINNTLMLIEIARKKGNYIPDLSFGTHFFQDLVESNIRYLPLYPDEPDIIFKSEFFLKKHNSLKDLLPSYARFANVVKVIDIPRVADGMIMQVLMNGELNQALAILVPPVMFSKLVGYLSPQQHDDEDHHRWRLRMAEQLASQLDGKEFGVTHIYLTGGIAKSMAQPASDIDLLICFNGNKTQKKQLESWLEGWSLCLDEINYTRTGFKAGGLLDVKIMENCTPGDTNEWLAKLNIDYENNLMELPMTRSQETEQ